MQFKTLRLVLLKVQTDFTEMHFHIKKIVTRPKKSLQVLLLIL